MSKTLGQIHIDAYQAGPTGEKGAHAIAAVARHVVAEALAAHVAECHAKPFIPFDTSNSGTIITGDVKQTPQPEAGDWAMEASKECWRCGYTPEMFATVIREAAERHYGQKIADLQKQLNAERRWKEHGWDDMETLTKERDAARAEVERLRNEFDKVLADVERNKPHTPPAATGEGELKEVMFNALAQFAPLTVAENVLAAIRPLFDALRRERDKWREGALQECQLRKDRDNEVRRWQQLASDDFWAWQGDGTDNLESLTCAVHIMPAELLAIVKRAEAAESALAELKEAMEWITCSGCSPSKGKDGRWRSMFLLDDGIEAATLADAILAAYRNTKAASVAEGTVKS